MAEENRTEHPSWPVFSFAIPRMAMWVGTPAAIVCACVYGLPWHAVVLFAVMLHLMAVGTTMGLHRLFSHRSFQTYRPLEWVLMVLGAMTGQSSPFFWVATHRHHHRFSDRYGDPHSPHAGDGKRTNRWRRFWHGHQGWTFSWASYDPEVVRDLMKRPDLAWIDRYWFAWYLLGLAIPTVAGYLIGGTAYDALMGFLWGGMLRHTVNQQGAYAVNSLGHLWGSRPFATGDQSRNNLLLGVLAMGEGWHNNHHAHPYSARHGFRWWQPDHIWNLVWLMERIGLAWKVKRPKLDARSHKEPIDATVTTDPTPASAAING